MPAANVHRFFELHAEVPGFYALESAVLLEFFIDCIDTQGDIFSGDILEVGTFQGKSARHLAMHARPGETLYLCDPFEGMPAVAEAVQQHCAGHVRGFRAFSSQISPAEIADNSVRFAYLDGEHGRNAIMTDMALADRVLRAEGIAILDDFLNPEFMGVTIGAIEWMTTHPGRFTIILASTGKAVLCRPGFVAFYLRLVRDFMPRFFREAGYTDFTLSRSSWASDCVTIGLTGRRADLDFIMRETDFEDMDAARRVTLTF